jgi:predicted nuclease of predicted toxin-antitoxin system
MMQFLADESCDALIVLTLRDLGYNVTYIAEIAPGMEDDQILAQALKEERLLLTEDRDFCELVFRDAKPTYGIVLIRIRARYRLRKADRIATLVNNYGERLVGSMTTLALLNIRVRPLP